MHATALVLAALVGSALAVVPRQSDDSASDSNSDSDSDSDSGPSSSYSMDAPDSSEIACATALDAIVSGAPPIPSDVVSYLDSYVEYATASSDDECHISMPASIRSEYSSYIAPYSSWYNANSAEIFSIESKCGYVDGASYYSLVCATDTIISASSRATATAGATATATATDGTTASDKAKAATAKPTTSTASKSATATAPVTTAFPAFTGAAARDSVMVGAVFAAVGLVVVAL